MITHSLVRVPGIFSGTVATREHFKDGCILGISAIKSTDLSVAWHVKAIIVQEDKILPHVGVVCRICGIPIIYSENLDKLYGKQVWIDGLSGRIYEEFPKKLQDGIASLPEAWRCDRRLQVSVCDSRQVAALGMAKIPLTVFVRHEFLWLTSHLDPFRYLRENGPGAFEDYVYDRLLPFAKAMDLRHRLHFRSLDPRLNEIDFLRPTGVSEIFENGLALTLQFPELLEAEANACKRITDDFGLNLVYSFPYVRTHVELRRALKLVETRMSGIDLGVFIETPLFAAEVGIGLVSDLRLDLFVGTKDLAANFFGYTRGVGTSDTYNPVRDRLFLEMISSVAAANDKAGSRCFYFCFLEHLHESTEVLPQSLGLSICAYEFALISKMPLSRFALSQQGA